MKKLFVLFLSLFLAASFAFGQAANTLTPTYLDAAITATTSQIPVHSATGITSGSLSSGTVGSTIFFPASGEAATVRSINGTVLTVTRGVNGTIPAAHISGEAVYYGAPSLFYSTDPAGGCSISSTHVDPWINVKDNRMWTCYGGTAGFWGVASSTGFPQSTRYVSTALTGSNTAYTAQISDFIIEGHFTLASADGVVTLPAAARCPGKRYIVVDGSGQAGGSYHITLAAASIMGTTTATCTGTHAYGTCEVISNGSTWTVLQANH